MHLLWVFTVAAPFSSPRVVSSQLSCTRLYIVFYWFQFFVEKRLHLSTMSSTGVPAITTSAPSNDGNTATTVPAPDPNLFGEWSAKDVPQHILDVEIEDSTLFADVLHSGPRSGSGISSEEARIKGMSKNHWVWRFTFKFMNTNTGLSDTGGVQFSMEMKEIESVGSNVARYVPSSGGRLSDGGTFSDFTPDKAAPPPWSAASVPSDTSSNKGGSIGSGSDRFSDVSDQKYPPSIRSSDGRFIQQPVSGVPHPARFKVRCKDWRTASRAALVTFSFKLRPRTTFGNLLKELKKANFEPFLFRKLNFAFLGCRDFVSQAAAVWLREGLMLTGEDIESGEHIFNLLCNRYTRPGPYESGATQSVKPGYTKSFNKIDRAVWGSVDFSHIEDERLQYNQDVAA